MAIFSFSVSFSQALSVEVVYKEKLVKNPIDTSGTVPGDYKLIMFEEMEKVRNILGNIDYVLLANQNEAIFEYVDFMENDANANMMNAILASSADGKFYSNSSEKLYFWQVEGQNGQEYRISSEDKNKEWTITGERRKIGEYDCFKATKNILLNNRLPIEVVAWFTPEIPFSFGPKGYGGLPGLIIALNERGFYSYAEKITFSDKSVRIRRPTEGELVTPEEFDQRTGLPEM